MINDKCYYPRKEFKLNRSDEDGVETMAYDTTFFV